MRHLRLGISGAALQGKMTQLKTSVSISHRYVDWNYLLAVNQRMSAPSDIKHAFRINEGFLSLHLTRKATMRHLRLGISGAALQGKMTQLKTS